jgi:hypothetical protein
MKEVVIDRENKRVTQVKKEIKDREKKIQQNKEYLSKEGNDILKIKKIRDKREKNALIQHDLVLEGYEKKRLKEAERTENRLKEYEDNLNEKRRARNEGYNEKLKKSYQEHEKNLKIRDEKYEQMIKERDDKFFEKYTNAYWSKKNRANQRREKKNNHLKHLEQIREMREEQDKLYMKKLKKFQKKLNDVAKRKEEIEQRRKDEIEKFARTQKEKFERVQDNLLTYKEEDDEDREAVLDYQREYVINKAMNKDIGMELRKANARDNVILADMEMYKMMGKFNKDINKIQNESMLKLSDNRRKQMYKDLLREEAERKKKEEEDKKFQK